MIALKAPITITYPPFNGKAVNPVTIDSIDYVVIYDNSKRQAKAIIKKLHTSIILWDGSAYDNAGNFTDADVDTRLAFIIGSDPQTFLQGLVK